MVGTIARETKREGKKKAKRRIAYRNKKRKKLVLLVVESYFTHRFFNVTCM
jgi:hypothetical protein